MHALEKDPRSRPQSITSFAQELATAVRAVTDLEFKDLFSEATEKELEAALLLASEGTGRRPNTGEYSRPGVGLNESTAVRQPARRTEEMPKRIQGHLSWFDFATVVYILAGMKETGLLTLHNIDLAPGSEEEIEQMRAPFAWLYLEGGDVKRARLGVRTGSEAFYQLFQMPLEGCFLFRRCGLPADLEATEPIEDTGIELLNEALDLKTLLSRFTLKFPDMLLGFRRSSDQMSWREPEFDELAQTLWNILAQPGIMLLELLARSPCCNAKTYRVLATLLATHQITIVKTADTDDLMRPASSDF